MSETKPGKLKKFRVQSLPEIVDSLFNGIQSQARVRIAVHRTLNLETI
jgi:hypothetical protein